MKIPMELKCSRCDARGVAKIKLDATSVDWTCQKCGERNPRFFGLDLTVGVLLLERSRYELFSEKDYSMAIVLAAVALDSELTWLFRNWTKIAQLKARVVLGDEQSEVLLRRFRDIATKINRVSRLLHSGGIDGFVGSSPSWKLKISREFPSLCAGSLADSFKKSLFWPRNRILHSGHAASTEEEATRCYRIACLGVHLFQEMDRVRRNPLRSD